LLPGASGLQLLIQPVYQHRTLWEIQISAKVIPNNQKPAKVLNENNHTI